MVFCNFCRPKLQVVEASPLHLQRKQTRMRYENMEGCILYQYMWLPGSKFDFTIADGIQQGRFKRYIQHRMISYNKVSVIDIRIDADGKLYSGKTTQRQPRRIPPGLFCIPTHKMFLGEKAKNFNYLWKQKRKMLYLCVRNYTT